MEPISNTTHSLAQSYKTQNKPQAEAKPATAPPAKAAPKFMSPVGNIDPKQGTYTVQFRDTETGEVRSEYPRKVAISQYSKATSQSSSPAPSSSEGAAQSSPAPAPAPVETTKVSGDRKADVKV